MFFQELIDTLRETHRFTSAKVAQVKNWYSFSSGYSQFEYSARFTGQQKARVEVYIDSGDADENRVLFDRLAEHKATIECDLGHALDWQPLEEKRACRIATVRPGSIEDSDDLLEEINKWMVERLLVFKRVFDVYLQELNSP